MITRLYTGDDGQSHFEELDMDVGPYPWRELRTATGIMFRHDEPGKFLDWHPAPRRQFVITLSGQVEIGLGDGTLRHFGAGDVMLAEIKHTLLMPLNVTDDKARAERFIKGLGPGSMAGPRDYVIDRIGQFVDAGVDEIMFGAIPTGDVEAIQRVEEEIVAAFV